MARDNSGGIGNLLGLAIIALIIGGVVYSARDTSEPPVQAPVEQPKVVEQPKGVSTNQLIEKIGIGDGTLGAAQSISASDLGKATAISGGGFKVSSSGSSRRSSSASSTPTPTTRSGG